jgi:hypothetical protein
MPERKPIASSLPPSSPPPSSSLPPSSPLPSSSLPPSSPPQLPPSWILRKREREDDHALVVPKVKKRRTRTSHEVIDLTDDNDAGDNLDLAVEVIDLTNDVIDLTSDD